ncbi:MULTISPECIES: aspartate kinase [unclassified Methylibium]|uniref:amino acid kinase family protein n=1 Tax=unclassified Methylibium TaxID=2633235 RepID=UPI0006FDFB12|nr:aspartate kinase [Methylibium sp. Root1272]KQW66236.1 aspartate kinase [Methylibium sp. Root1272]
MWVVKLGGSLNQDASLPQWLDLLAELGGGRVIVVPGGGAFADQVRDAQSQWQFDDLAAHNMAVLGMAQTALMLQGLCPALQAAAGEQPLRRVLQGGQTALWLPLDLLRSRPDELTNWGVSSDSLALWLAQRLHAERLLVVKSCAIDGRRSLAQLGETGVLDAEFAQRARQAAFPIDLLHKGELARARALLLDESLSCRPFAD